MRKVLIVSSSLGVSKAVMSEILKRDDVIVSEKMPNIEPISRRFGILPPLSIGGKAERKRNRKNRWS